jgi:hypothetical protein
MNRDDSPMMSLQPVEEVVGEDVRYNWQLPLATTASLQDKRIRSVWYFGLPLTSAHRGSHSGGGAPIDGAGEQQRYANEGTVYPHAGLLEMITYQELCFPEIEWRYVDLSHRPWPEVREELAIDPPDVIAVTVYTATALWALIVAAEVKRINPDAVVVFGNDHAGILYREILSGAYGSRIVDFVSTGNNGPFTMMGLLYALQGQLDLTRVPSLAYRDNGAITNRRAPTFPLNLRILPDYRLIIDQLELHYDQAFNTWYSHHYRLKRMVTLPLDSTLGFSRTQWNGATSYLDELAEKCSRSPVLKHERFMLASSTPRMTGLRRKTLGSGVTPLKTKALDEYLT